MAVAANTRNNERQLQPKQKKDEAIQQELRCFPYRPCLQAHLRRKEGSALAAEIQPADDNGDDP